MFSQRGEVLHRKGKIVAGIFCALLTSASSADAAPMDCPTAAKSLTEIAQRELGNSAAEAELRSIIVYCPDLAEAHFFLGLSIEKQNRVEEALKSFQKAADLKRDPRFLVAVGNAYIQLKNFKAAEQAYGDALKLSSTSTKAMQGMSVLLYEQGNTSGSEDMLRRAIQIAPEDASLFYNLGVVLLRSGRVEEASESFRAATERRSPYPEALTQQGAAALRLGRFDQAERAFREAALHDPKNPAVWTGLGSALDGQGSYKAAQAQFEKALSVQPGYTPAQLNSAIVTVKAGELDQGLNRLRMLEKQNPHDGSVLGALGWALLQAKDFDAAEQALENATRLNPRDALSWNNLGVLYRLRGDDEKARAALEHAKAIRGAPAVVDSNLSALRE